MRMLSILVFQKGNMITDSHGRIHPNGHPFYQADDTKGLFLTGSQQSPNRKPANILTILTSSKIITKSSLLLKVFPYFSIDCCFFVHVGSNRRIKHN